MSTPERILKQNIKEAALDTCSVLEAFTARRIMADNFNFWRKKVNNAANEVRREIRKTHPDFPTYIKMASETSDLNRCLTPGLTKNDIADYYEKVFLIGYQIGSKDVAQYFVGNLMQVFSDQRIWHAYTDESERAVSIAKILRAGVGMKHKIKPSTTWIEDNVNFQPIGKGKIPNNIAEQLKDLDLNLNNESNT